MSKLRRALYTSLAGLSFGLGIIGAFLPLMPTTVFMLLALWLASKGSPRFARWIRCHPRFGPPIVSWETEGAISRQAKYLACAMLALSMLMIALSVESRWLQAILIPGLALIGVWLATRPEPTQGVCADPSSPESVSPEPAMSGKASTTDNQTSCRDRLSTQRSSR
ncbi:YbaN family protein [Halomonas sp. PR-M31]|uniref:YbaN family protein n=1 Tax=Halomonas sp. PR-M31 TaxID=1471202 RepID=UPI0009E284EB|nr:YbaN family protein [Halomonas sp. PR-M31]